MLQPEQLLTERYQLKQKLGNNAGRQTWLATDLQTQPPEPVVVKLLTFGGEVQWEDLKLFEREAQVLKQLNHPFIPKYRDYFSLDEKFLWFGLVQEYIPGLSLKEKLNQGTRFTEAEVKKIAEDILNILIYLHQLNPPLLHRDIKPSNLIIGENEQIYLVDFGAVQDKAAKEGATFTVVGTYGYAPIEQFGGRTVPASDLYALGATIIHLLTGTSPADLPQQNLRIQFKDKVSVSSSFISWIEKIIEPAVERRFSTAKQALDALKFSPIQSANLRDQPKIKTISLPPNTRIQLTKSLQELRIKIPARGIKLFDMPRLLFRIFWAGIGLWGLIGGLLLTNGLIWSTFGLILLLWMWRSIIPYYFGNTYLSFNRQDFKIVKQGFILNTYWYIDEIANIQYVFCQGTNHSKRIVIKLDAIEYSFGEGLSLNEHAWLTHEIQSWLNLM